MGTAFRVGIVQHDPTIGDVDGNAEQVAAAHEQLSGADIVVAPELSLLGYPPRDLLHRSGVLAAQERALADLASRTADGPPLVVGAAVGTDEETGPPLHNAAVVLRDGERAATYAKRLLPTYDVFDEHRYFAPGEEPVVVSVDGREVGLTVCEDAWHDAVVTGQRRYETDPLGETAAAGADIVVTLAASPFSLDKPARRERRFLDHAAATGRPVVFVNQVGGNDELVFDGHSLVVDGDGVARRLAGFEPDAAVVDVLPGADGSAGGTDAAGDGPEVDRFDRDRASQARAALGLGVSDYFEKTGFEEAVIGLSGGIDSSVAAALAADALGAENVLGVSLPSRVTTDRSVADARALAERLGIGFETVPIGPVVDRLAAALADDAETPPTGVAAENLQARVRGDVLMGIANERDALVLTPDNKSEAAVGYCTLYGDTVGALAPLGDCYKRTVYDLAAAFNRRPPNDAAVDATVIPESVVEKAPTAELREGQSDADDLPPYDELDPVLADYIDGTDTAAALAGRHPEPVVEAALSRVARSEFKRRQTPPPLRITRKALGRGWNYPVAASYEHVRRG